MSTEHAPPVITLTTLHTVAAGSCWTVPASATPVTGSFIMVLVVLLLSFFSLLTCTRVENIADAISNVKVFLFNNSLASQGHCWQALDRAAVSYAYKNTGLLGLASACAAILSFPASQKNTCSAHTYNPNFLPV